MLNKFFEWGSTPTESTKGDDLVNNIIFVLLLIDTIFLFTS